MKQHRNHLSMIAFLSFLPITCFSTLATQANNPTQSVQRETLIQITANNQVAQVLCFGNNPTKLDEIHFKGPGGDKIKVWVVRDYYPGYIFEFHHVGSASVFKSFTALGFSERGLPIPVINSFNGKIVAGLGDGGSRESDFHSESVKEFEKLDSGFQQALREFYLFCNETTPGVIFFTIPLITIGEELGLKPYPIMDEMIEPDQNTIKAFKLEFTK
ncbi:MAG: hypothetical protein WC450_10230 [Candidatus Omnitrophota bacterium]|jgi:hypothetical protein